MKVSAAAAILAFTATALSAPTSTITMRSLFGRSLQNAIDDCGNTSDPSLCVDTVNTINDWDNSVNIVNNFLNIANQLTGQDIINNALTALQAANLEPGFLSTLQSTPGLSQTGQDAANILSQVFSAVPANLNEVANSQISTSDAVDNVNNARCSFPGDGNILENIGILWAEAAAAVGADAPGSPLGPLVCQKGPSNTGDAYN